MTDAHTGQCVTCEWWDADYLSDDITAQGQCRRYPPSEEQDWADSAASINVDASLPERRLPHEE